MARTTARRRDRSRGRIEVLPSGSLRVVLFAGRDPLTKRRIYLRETVPPGPKATAEAEKLLRKLTVQVDEKRNPRTSATIEKLLSEHFELLEVEPSTLATYRSLAATHILPLIGKQKVRALQAAVFDSFYAELRRCRAHCDRRPYIEHRIPRSHECDRRCRPHACRGLSRSTIRQIHVILSGALKRAVRWHWIPTNPIEHAESPPQPAPNPRPPSAEEAARILAGAWVDPDWAVLIWLSMVTGFRRGELCALRWSDVDLASGVLSVDRAIAQLNRTTWEKDTKTHQRRRIALDPETVALLTGHRQRCVDRAAQLEIEHSRDAFVFSPDVDGGRHLKPSTVGRRYARLARRMGIATTIHKLRHYSATELISAGVDVRTVAGRLGHGGGGTTTLRVYAAWVSEADQRAAEGLLTRMPERPEATLGTGGPLVGIPRNPSEHTAADLRAQILDGRLLAGSLLPSRKTIAETYKIAVGTAHRAVAMLADWGLVAARPGQRAVVLNVPAADPAAPALASPRLVEAVAAAEDLAERATLVDLELRRRGDTLGRWTTAVDSLDARVLQRLLSDAIRRTVNDTAGDASEYELVVTEPGSPEVLTTFVANC